MEDKRYPIMDKSNNEIFGELIEDEVVTCVKTAASIFYKVKGELIAYSVGSYMDNRFIERQHRFVKEEELLSPKQVRQFYENIDESKLDLLFELLDKARTSTYALHAKILAKLYGNFLKNGELDYHEKTFLSNISILNDVDLLKFYSLLDEFFNENGIDIDTVVMKKEKIVHETKTYADIYIYDKLLSVGLISELNLGRGSDIAMYAGKSRDFYIHNFSKVIYLFMKEILEEKK